VATIDVATIDRASGDALQGRTENWNGKVYFSASKRRPPFLRSAVLDVHDAEWLAAVKFAFWEPTAYSPDRSSIHSAAPVLPH
jgi:hypothetical protein